jgi:hypothetical protein
MRRLPFLCHPELVSGYIVSHGRVPLEAEWMLKRVQHDDSKSHNAA